jgi:hypothetical protein
LRDEESGWWDLRQLAIFSLSIDAMAGFPTDKIRRGESLVAVFRITGFFSSGI